MPKSKTTLREMLNPTPKKATTPKELRELEIRELGEWLVWVEITKDRCNKELISEEVQIDMLGIIQKQFLELSKTQEAMSILMSKYCALIANEKYLEYVLSNINKNICQIEKIE